MTTVTRAYVSRLAGLPVFDPNGDRGGKVRDVVVALRAGEIPRSLQKATRWACGTDIGMQQQKPAMHSSTCTRLGCRPPMRRPAAALARSRAPRSFATSDAFSNCDTAPRIWRTISAAGVGSVK